MIKRLLKNERGLTLVELLAVVVILGIIAAIAVPSIGGIIDNTKKDAHVANAQQLVSSAKVYMAAENVTVPKGGTGEKVTLAKLKERNYIADIKDPNGKGGKTEELENSNYNPGTTNIVIKKTENGYEYYVTLIGGSGTTYIQNVEINKLNRDSVSLPSS